MDRFNPGKLLLLAIILVASTAGCGKKDASLAGGDGLQVALLTPGPTNDKGWNGLAWDALKQMEKDTGARTAHLQTKSSSEIEAGLRDFANRGFDIVVGHGNEYGEPVLKVARDFPNTRFVISSGRVNSPNVTSLVFRLDDATYVLGVLAAGMSRSNKAACVGGQEFKVVEETFDGFARGAQSIKPNLKIPYAYIGSWDDSNMAKQQTATLINQGADVVFHNADAAGLGVFQAVQEANKAGKKVWALGSNADQSSIAPDVVLASAVMDLAKTLDAIYAEVKENRFEGAQRRLGIKEGFVSVVFNPALKDQVPPDVMQNVEAAIEKIRSGELVVTP